MSGPAAACEDDSIDGEMARINEAYRVLGDPGRRALYDRSLQAGALFDPPRDADTDDDLDFDFDVAAPPPRPNLLDPSGPARFPWKLTAVAAVVGSALVLISAALADAPADEVPDGILQIGSCVEIEANGDAREVACTGEDDVVVELFLSTEAECPADLEPHRDRLGLGIACVQR